MPASLFRADFGEGHLHYDVAVIGSGCGGLWLAHELLRRSHSTVLIEQGRVLGSYATTRGQNRLHTGAMYALSAGTKSQKIIDASVRGYQALLDFAGRYAPGAIQRNRECLYMYQDAADFAAAMLNAEPFSQTGLRQLSQFELSNARYDDAHQLCDRLEFAFASPECTFDAFVLLGTVLRRIFELGGAFVSLPSSLTEVSLERISTSSWQVIGPTEEVTASTVIFATGAMIGHFAQKFVEQHKDRTLVEVLKGATDRQPVAVFHTDIVKRVTCFQKRDVYGYIAAMPVGWRFSVTTELPIESEADEEECDAILESIAEGVVEHMPGLKDKLPIYCHLYACEKANNFDHPSNVFPLSAYGKRHFFWVPLSNMPGVFLYSPGKWTISLVAAEEFVNDYEKRNRLLTPRDPLVTRDYVGADLTIAPRAALSEETHILSRESDGRLSLTRLQ